MLFKKYCFKFLINYNFFYYKEHALASIDETTKRLQYKMRQLEGEIRELTRLQTNCGQQGNEKIDEAKRAIEVLIEQLLIIICCMYYIICPKKKFVDNLGII